MEYIVAKFNISCAPTLMEVARDLVADAAAEAGFESFEETPQGLDAYVQKEQIDTALLDANLSDLMLEDTHVSYTLHDAENKDWNEQWELAGFDPININDRVVIYDDRKERQPVAEGVIPVYIHARQAFGTGTHQTTRMVIATLLDMAMEGKRVLDCGCGTGILGIVTSKLGAEEVVGYDIDEWSVENSQHNARQNSVDNLSVFHGNASVLSHVCGVFDVVVANINRNILIQDLHAFKEVMVADATLVLSGFYEDDVPMLLEAAKAYGLSEVGRRTDDGWCCLQLK